MVGDANIPFLLLLDGTVRMFHSERLWLFHLSMSLLMLLAIPFGHGREFLYAMDAPHLFAFVGSSPSLLSFVFCDVGAYEAQFDEIFMLTPELRMIFDVVVFFDDHLLPTLAVSTAVIICCVWSTTTSLFHRTYVRFIHLFRRREAAESESEWWYEHPMMRSRLNWLIWEVELPLSTEWLKLKLEVLLKTTRQRTVGRIKWLNKIIQTNNKQTNNKFYSGYKGYIYIGRVQTIYLLKCFWFCLWHRPQFRMFDERMDSHSFHSFYCLQRGGILTSLFILFCLYWLNGATIDDKPCGTDRFLFHFVEQTRSLCR